VGTTSTGEIGASSRSGKGTRDFSRGSICARRVEGGRSGCAWRRLVQGLRNVQIVRHRAVSEYFPLAGTGGARQTAV